VTIITSASFTLGSYQNVATIFDPKTNQCQITIESSTTSAQITFPSVNITFDNVLIGRSADAQFGCLRAEVISTKLYWQTIASSMLGFLSRNINYGPYTNMTAFRNGLAIKLAFPDAPPSQVEEEIVVMRNGTESTNGNDVPNEMFDQDILSTGQPTVSPGSGGNPIYEEIVDLQPSVDEVTHGTNTESTAEIHLTADSSIFSTEGASQTNSENAVIETGGTKMPHKTSNGLNMTIIISASAGAGFVVLSAAVVLLIRRGRRKSHTKQNNVSRGLTSTVSTVFPTTMNLETLASSETSKPISSDST
jgi:hypothetical protein